MYKSKLQELCNKKKWAMPKYSYMRNGPLHNTQYNASVVVNGTNFDAVTTCKTMKDAYNEAAKLAVLHFTSDLEQKYKMKLQLYTERNNLGLPIYCTNEEGSPNDFCYKTSVTIGGDVFEGQGYFKTIDLAEESAAQTALMALSNEDDFQENDIRMYKNLLQEFCRKEGLLMSNYVTARYGEAHEPVFISTVEIEGETFKGDLGKSKKQAEHNAAKVAYKSVLQRKSGRMYGFSSTATDDEVLKLALEVEKVKLVDPGVKIIEDVCKNVSTRVTESYLLNNRVKVYKYVPDLATTTSSGNGNVVLPIAEDKWIIANLEFPNQDA